MTSKKKNANSRVAFLFGAGASVDAGLPTAAGLSVKLDDWLDRERRDLLPALRFVTGALQFGRSCRGERISDVTNIEDILSVCAFLASRDSSFVYPFVGAWHEQLGSIQRGFATTGRAGNPFEELGAVCRQQLRIWLEIDTPERVKYLWSLQAFINAGFGVDIFTLNYDLAVELALNGIRGEVNGNWTVGFDATGWKPELLTRDFSARLFKLHGSLDWVRDEKLGLCSLQWPAATESEEIPETTEPLLIFGTDAKLQAVDPFLTLLFWFQQRLFESSALIVIGYSFNDRHVNDVIWEAMQRDAKKRCIVVNSDAIASLLSADPKLARLASVERRFREIKTTAKVALEQDLALRALTDAAGEQASEEPF
jgi:hypothetical protein